MFLLPLGYLPSLVCCIENLFHTHSCSNILLLCMANFYLNFECGVDNTLRVSLKFCLILKLLTMFMGSTKHNRFLFFCLSMQTMHHIIFQHIDKSFYWKFWDAIDSLYKNHKYSLTDNQFIKSVLLKIQWNDLSSWHAINLMDGA